MWMSGREVRFFLVDVFAEQPLAGNPLAVVADADRPDAERLAAELAALDGQGCYLFALDPLSDTAVAYARFFNPTVGIWEDPATGSAAGPLGCHLAKAAAVADGSDVVVEQGHCVGRPSRIHVRVEGENVRVSGAAVVAAEGTLRLPR
jgi:PhzF family phenazine biosynthesis protein